MFEISVATMFHAVHAVTVAGFEETPHDHDWEVVAVVKGDTLNSDGLLVDFLELQQHLEEVVSPLREANLNICDALDGKNPTAEQVAWYIATQLRQKIQPHAKISSVQVTEAPNCIATYRP